MKKVIIVFALALLLIGCKKSDTEVAIERLDEESAMYRNRQAKLQYLKDLIEIRGDITLKERARLVDSLINEEKIKIEQN